MISLDKIKEAHKKIAPYVNSTPLIHSDFLSQSKTVKLKLESLQITGSFKLRGAVNKLLSLSEEQKKQMNKGIQYNANQPSVEMKKGEETTTRLLIARSAPSLCGCC